MPLDPLGPARSKAACPSLATPRTAALRSTPALQEPPQPDVMMTRLPSRRLLALALASAIAMPALAQTTEPAAAPVASAPAVFSASDVEKYGYCPLTWWLSRGDAPEDLHRVAHRLTELDGAWRTARDACSGPASR